MSYDSNKVTEKSQPIFRTGLRYQYLLLIIVIVLVTLFSWLSWGSTIYFIRITMPFLVVCLLYFQLSAHDFILYSDELVVKKSLILSAVSFHYPCKQILSITFFGGGKGPNSFRFVFKNGKKITFSSIAFRERTDILLEYLEEMGVEISIS